MASRQPRQSTPSDHDRERKDPRDNKDGRDRDARNRRERSRSRDRGDRGGHRGGRGDYRARRPDTRSRSPRKDPFQPRDETRQRSPPRGPRSGRPASPPRHRNGPSTEPRQRGGGGASQSSSRAPGGAGGAGVTDVNTNGVKSGADAMEEDGSDEEAQMRRVMGFAGFRTTKNTKVPGNDKLFGLRKDKQTEYRQYMNRQGGFNRPLSPGKE